MLKVIKTEDGKYAIRGPYGVGFRTYDSRALAERVAAAVAAKRGYTFKAA
jgi:hypothetical protein